jgi:predicted dinucleotide-binding enzyme
MKIGILGSGEVARTLGAGFLRHSHELMMGTRSSAKLEAWRTQHAKARVGSFTEAAEFADMVVLAVKGTAALEAVQTARSGLRGKTVIDATNPIADVPPVHGVLTFFTNLNEALMEQLQKAVPEANFVKAFNSVGNARMVNPQYAAGRPTMFICGNHAPAKQAVGQILDQFGWETEDMGGAEAARAIEPLCMLWCIPGFLHNQWTHAFKLLK